MITVSMTRQVSLQLEPHPYVRTLWYRIPILPSKGQKMIRFDMRSILYVRTLQLYGTFL